MNKLVPFFLTPSVFLIKRSTYCIIFSLCGLSWLQNSMSFATHFKKHYNKQTNLELGFQLMSDCKSTFVSLFSSSEKFPLKKWVMVLKSRPCSFAHFLTERNITARLLPAKHLALNKHNNRTVKINFIFLVSELNWGVKVLILYLKSFWFWWWENRKCQMFIYSWSLMF